MHPETITLLQNPYTGEQLKLENSQLVSHASKQVFPIQNGIPIFITEDKTRGRSHRFRHFYDKVAFGYDFVEKIGNRLKINSEGNIRKEYIGNLVIQTGDKVLETAIGTASNIFFLPTNGDYYGLDISRKMLNEAQKKLIEAQRKVELFQGDGAYLPFKDNSFDLVFQMGGLQFYSDPSKGVHEMARVAKPETTIHILDEKRSIGGILRRIPGSDFVVTKGNISDLQHLVPLGMQRIQSKEISQTDFFLLTFYKP